MKSQKKVFKNIEKGLQDLKEGKTTEVNNAGSLFEEFERKRREHPVYYFFHDIYRRIVNWVNMLPLRIRSFFQRGRRGFAYADTWCFCAYLSKVIAEGVEHLKKYKIGMPTWKEGKTDEEAEKEWNDILNAIIKTFKTAQKICEGELCYTPSKDFNEKNYKKIKELYDKDKDMFRPLSLEETLEFEEGFQKFQEWFFSLWD